MSQKKYRGPIAWTVRNTVAANLLMLLLLIGGVFMATRVEQEVFPEFQMDYVQVTVPYPGASPEEVESAIVLAVEEAVRGVEGIKEVRSAAAEGFGSVTAEVLLGEDVQAVVADVKSAVDRITSFPGDAERPTVRQLSNRRQVISLVLYGDQSEHVLRDMASRLRDELLSYDGITVVELEGVRQPEISVEVPQAALRSFGLTLPQIAQKVRASAIELPGGGVKTSSGEVLLRMAERRDLGREFEDISVLSAPGGADVRLGDIATIEDGFTETDETTWFNDKPAAMINVFRVGNETPLSVAAIVKEHLEKARVALPPGVEVSIFRDWSDIYRQRIDLLMRNAYLGLIFVIVLLGLFLEIRLAFWVTLGIPISFLGSLLFLPALGVSFNMISLFAFILVLGLVVDDAIVVGENIYEYRQRGYSIFRAAVEGTREVAAPVVFAVLTTIVAFSPLLFVPGFVGKFFGVMPVIVISVLLISIVESLFILPAHLGHQFKTPERGLLRWIILPFGLLSRPFFALAELARRGASAALHWVIQKTYRPSVELALRIRYFAVAAAVAVAVMALGWVQSGRIERTDMPRIESENMVAVAELPFGSPPAETEKVRQHLTAAANGVLEDLGGPKYRLGVYSRVGQMNVGGGPRSFGGSGAASSHVASVTVRLVPIDQRPFNGAEFVRRWREEIGEITGLRSLVFDYEIGVSPGAAIDVQLSHHDVPTLERAASELASTLRGFDGVKNIEEGFASGKPQLDLQVTDAARTLGMTAFEVGQQVRSAFYGAEALRQQRGRDEIRVMVRLPDDERTSEHAIEELLVTTPRGGEVPLAAAATVDRGRAYTSISRFDGRRIVNVTADVEEGVANAEKVLEDLRKDALPKLKDAHPGLTSSFEGQHRSMREAMQSLFGNFAVAILVIYALLAIPFRSYLQPIIVMSAIPFGFVGALLGHILMGFSLSNISMMGVVALSGVVVNDSLVLVVAANRFRQAGRSTFAAVRDAGIRRFRPILLTSLTTFLGLAPMIFETSIQARFLIPMAISLGFGVLFSTFIILLIVPALYAITDDVRALLGLVSTEAVAEGPDGPGEDDATRILQPEQQPSEA